MIESIRTKPKRYRNSKYRNPCQFIPRQAGLEMRISTGTGCGMDTKLARRGFEKGSFGPSFLGWVKRNRKKKTRTTECSSCLFIYVFIYFSLKVMEADWIQALLMILNLLWSEEEEDDSQATLAALHFWLFSDQHVFIWLNHPHVSFPFEKATLLLRSGLPSTRKRWSWTASQTQLFFDGLVACELPWVPEASRGPLSAGGSVAFEKQIEYVCMGP